MRIDCLIERLRFPCGQGFSLAQCCFPACAFQLSEERRLRMGTFVARLSLMKFGQATLPAARSYAFAFYFWAINPEGQARP
jgi:hypothetical protein